MKKYFLLLLSSFLTTTAWCGPTAPQVGDAPPDLTIEKLLQAPDGASANWSALEGKVVVLEFWATWCGPCVMAIPHINELAAQFRDRPVQFISITDEPEEKILAFLKKKPINTWIGLDTNRSVNKAFQIKAIPRTFLIGTKGLLAGVTHPSSLSAKHIEALLAGEELDPAHKDNKETVAAEQPAEKAAEALFYVSLRPSAATNMLGYSWGGPSMKSEGFTPGEILPVVYKVNSTRIVTNVAFPDKRYDLEIKVPREKGDQLPPLAQKALETAFDFTTRRELREMDAWICSVVNTNAGLTPTATPDTSSSQTGRGCIKGVNLRMQRILYALERDLGKPVIDETKLTGGFDVDFVLDKNAPPNASVDPNTLISAVREKLGLELTQGRRSIEVLVVEPIAPSDRRATTKSEAK